MDSPPTTRHHRLMPGSRFEWMVLVATAESPLRLVSGSLLFYASAVKEQAPAMAVPAPNAVFHGNARFLVAAGALIALSRAMTVQRYVSLTQGLLVFLCGTGLVSGQAVSFARPTAIAVVGANSGSAVLSLVTADFNGDGKADIAYVGYVYGYQSNTLTVSLGNGDGTFEPEVTVANYNDTAITCCGAADVDGDGKVDLILTDALSNSILVYPGNGDGTFRPPVRTSLGNKGSVSFVTIADVNHDGKPDILMDTFVLLGNGDGTFRLHYTFDGGVAAIADFNHDGNVDVILVRASGQLAICLGHADGTFGQDVNIPTPFPAQNIIAGDFNGDGEIDLALATAPGMNQTADIAVLPGKGDGTFLQPCTTSCLF